MGQAVRTKLWPHHFFNHWPRRRRAEASTTSGSTTMRAKLPQSLIQHYQPASTIGLPYVDSLLAFMIALDDKEEEDEEDEDDKEEEEEEGGEEDDKEEEKEEEGDKEEEMK